MRTVTIMLPAVANEMVQEEIVKQLAHVSRAISNPRFQADGQHIDLDLDDRAGEGVAAEAEAVATRIQRSLRRLDRKVRHRTPEGWDGPLHLVGEAEGVWSSGQGQVQLSGAALAAVVGLDTMLDRYFSEWSPARLQTPTLIPAEVLARCDYFRSFPQYVSFVSHLHEDFEVIGGFRGRHQERDTLDEASRADLDLPDVCLSPAVCYHTYHRHASQTLPETGTAYDVAGRCFRYESTNMSDLRRLWEFTMRELVFIGTESWVLTQREMAIERFVSLLDALGMPAEIRTASDPFFVAADAVAKTYFQLSSETKFEISVALGEERLAVGSFNYHTDFFGRAFAMQAGDTGPAHSVCVGFGLERLAHAVVAHHGSDPAAWPDLLRAG